MRNQILFTSLFLFLGFITYSQLIVDDAGRIGVGAYFDTNNTVPGTSAFHVSGLAYINGGVGKGVTIDNYVGDVLLRGGYNNGGYLGKSTEKWGRIYGKYIYYDYLYQASDIKIKENIRPLEKVLHKILKMNPVIYDVKASYFEGSDPKEMEKLVAKSKNKVGIIAQEAKADFPDLVVFNEEADMEMVNYTDLIPYLIRAIQEQQEQIEELKDEIKELKKIK